MTGMLGLDEMRDLLHQVLSLLAAGLCLVDFNQIWDDPNE